MSPAGVVSVLRWARNVLTSMMVASVVDIPTVGLLNTYRQSVCQLSNPTPTKNEPLLRLHLPWLWQRAGPSRPVGTTRRCGGADALRHAVTEGKNESHE